MGWKGTSGVRGVPKLPFPRGLAGRACSRPRLSAAKVWNYHQNESKSFGAEGGGAVRGQTRSRAGLLFPPPVLSGALRPPR